MKDESQQGYKPKDLVLESRVLPWGSFFYSLSKFFRKKTDH